MRQHLDMEAKCETSTMSRAIDRRRALAVAGGLGGAALLGVSIAGAQQVAVQSQAPARLQGRAPVGAPVPIEVTARPISSFGRAVGVGAEGRLDFLGGLVMTSTYKHFGGWSGIVLSADGRRMLALSDRCNWMMADLVYEDGRPAAVTGATMGELPGLGGAALRRFRDRDCESVTLLEGTLSHGTVLVAFERNHRIGRFPVTERGLGHPLGYLKMPPDVRRMSSNKGFESVAVLRGGPLKGAVVAFGEEYHDPDRNMIGWIWARGIGSEPQRIILKNIGDFAVTDAASLPDGSLVVLERKFRWLEGLKARVRLIRATDIRPGAHLEGEILLDANMLAGIDNMEGLAVHRGHRGEIVLTLVSDNNFNSFLQRSLLLQFALSERPIKDAKGR